MGLQISRGLHTEMSEKDAVFPTAPAPWRGVSQAGSAEGVQGGGRTFDARSCTYDAVDPAEVRGVASGWVHQGQECDSSCKSLWGAQAQLRRPALLSEGLLCIDSRARRGGDTAVHP